MILKIRTLTHANSCNVAADAGFELLQNFLKRLGRKIWVEHVRFSFFL